MNLGAGNSSFSMVDCAARPFPWCSAGGEGGDAPPGVQWLSHTEGEGATAQGVYEQVVAAAFGGGGEEGQEGGGAVAVFIDSLPVRATALVCLPACQGRLFSRG